MRRNTDMTGFIWFSKLRALLPFALDVSSLSIGRVNVIAGGYQSTLRNQPFSRSHRHLSNML